MPARHRLSWTGATPWADSVFSSLSLDQRIAQLMMVAGVQRQGREARKGIEDMVRDRNIGGLIFFKGGPASAGETHQPVPSRGEDALAHRHGPGVGLGHALGQHHPLPAPDDLGCVEAAIR
jgi:hypothetical protein